MSTATVLCCISTTSSAIKPRTTTTTTKPGVLITHRLSLPFIGRQQPIRSTNHGRNTFKQPQRRSNVFMEWQDCTVKLEIDVPISVAYNCYLDREAIPQWMPFISSVKVLKDKPELSRWSYKFEAFGYDLDFSWLSRNLQPIPNQKIHWRSLEGLPNRGALTCSYEVPQFLSPVASMLQPFNENLMRRGLERFAIYAKTYKPDSA
ncbi:putative coenzyme Q-binding protein COQ10, START [Helianthus debilis subsp. tardiflorus]